MKRKPLQKLNAKHEIFIREMLEHGNQAKAYRKAYPDTSDESADAAASRLMDQPVIIQQMVKLFSEIRKEVKDLKVLETKEKLHNYMGIRDVLGDIITGRKQFQKLYKVGNDVKPFTMDAGATEVLRALDINVKVLKMLPEKTPKFIRRMALENKSTNEVKEVK